MLYNLRDQIFGRFKCENREKAEEITSHPKFKCTCYSKTVASSNNMDENECNYETQPQQHKQMVGIAHVECTADDGAVATVSHNKNHFVNGNKQQHNIEPSHRRQTQHTTISTANVYLIFATLFICICTITALLCTYIYQLHDVMQLRDNLTSELVGRRDIENIVRNVLKDMRSDDNEFR